MFSQEYDLYVSPLHRICNLTKKIPYYIISVPNPKRRTVYYDHRQTCFVGTSKTTDSSILKYRDLIHAILYQRAADIFFVMSLYTGSHLQNNVLISTSLTKLSFSNIKICVKRHNTWYKVIYTWYKSRS